MIFNKRDDITLVLLVKLDVCMYGTLTLINSGATSKSNSNFESAQFLGHTLSGTPSIGDGSVSEWSVSPSNIFLAFDWSSPVPAGL